MRGPVESGQPTSVDFTQELTDHGVLASVGSVGDAYDNAMAESFVDSFKTELVTDRVWQSRSQLELAVVEWLSWFNNDRLHESLGDLGSTARRPPRVQGPVLAGDRRGSQQRALRRDCGDLGPGRCPLVPRGWRNGADRPRPSFG